ncbi:UNKNOWN [Stylonychia lemnae]|uniref:Uncharacterized protein n=1 Tax=Stylonychia lemnae TaxID=5949 RepID=A0A078BB48_STYLE|nr:UNKNOWN [Stylonychia lemnae]|eukprot:CDW91406.1 UNKNOWN [Stylonychia lemnae]
MKIQKQLILIGLLGLVLISCQGSGSDQGGGDQPPSDGGNTEPVAPDNGNNQTGPQNQTEAQNQTDQNGGGGGATTNITNGGDALLQAIGQLGQSLNGSVYPVGAADNIISALNNLWVQSQYISAAADIVTSQSPDSSSGGSSGSGDQATFSSDQQQTTASLSQRQTWIDQANAADDRMYGVVDQQLVILFSAINEQQCYNAYTTGIFEIFVGWTKYRNLLLGLNLTDPLSLQSFCLAEKGNLESIINNMASLISGGGECDALQVLYDGSQESNIYTGWRDNLDDKAGYIIMYLAEGYVVLSACNQYEVQAQQNQNNSSNADNSSGSSNSSEPSGDSQLTQLVDYSSQLQSLIERVIQFDRQAKQSVMQTVGQNLNLLLKQNQGLSPEVLATNLNGYFIPIIYSQYLWQLGVVYSNASEQDFFSNCWSCVTVIQGDYRATVSWVSPNTTASLQAQDLQVLIQSGSSAEDNSNSIFANLGNCTSGVWIFNSSNPYFVSSQFSERLIYSLGQEYDIFAWGVQEDCRGQPLQGVY